MIAGGDAGRKSNGSAKVRERESAKVNVAFGALRCSFAASSVRLDARRGRMDAPGSCTKPKGDAQPGKLRVSRGDAEGAEVAEGFSPCSPSLPRDGDFRPGSRLFRR